MESTPIPNSGTTAGRGPDAQRPEQDMRQMRKSIDTAVLEVQRTLLELDHQQDMQESQQRWIKILTIVLAVLIVLFAAAGWYTYPIVRGNQTSAGQMLGLGSRIAVVESDQQAASEVVRQLLQEIANLQQEIVSLRQTSPATNKIRQTGNAQDPRSQQLPSPDRGIASNKSLVPVVAGQADKMRTDFALETRRTQEIAPGIYLTIGRTDVGKQEIDGTLQLSAESRMVPMRAVGIQKAALFYASGQKTPMELVITQVEANRATGYLLLPVTPPATKANDSGK